MFARKRVSSAGAGPEMKKKVLVCTWDLLPYSETFILNQAEALRRFDYLLVGGRLTKNGIKTPADKTMILKPKSFYGRSD